MSEDNFDDRVIAERELEMAGEHPRRVVVRMSVPVRVADGEWGCPFQIRGAGDERVRTAYGVDGVQALQLCMEMIRADLGALQRCHRLTWLGEDDLGF
ncbi:MAG TPA: hypothetical protein VGB24_24545 [Longimicrobium sp.]|jgi:hypothetical protein|uniref:DUF6968 family protein n=1 Tax=Longimicrobium sp. TaxID=2029185 RepID=UPI002ED93D09